MKIETYEILLQTIEDLNNRIKNTVDFLWLIVLYTELLCNIVAKWAIDNNKDVRPTDDKLMFITKTKLLL